ncbi:MAG: aldehyde ferredoxin oxidoreductase C-terminal domain-containing protein [Desulfobacterales bacterium]|nr:aldehyde ferredoxin oxidoreductase C-terminal domain-containing protein [Desulfobacterales bacterium]
MSGGCVLSFYADAIDHGARRRAAIRFGDAERRPRSSCSDAIAQREGEVGNILAEGSMRMAAHEFGHGSIEAYAMQVKGLEVAAYNCKFIPGHGPGLRGQPHRRPPQGILGHHLRDPAVRLRESYGPEKAPEGDRPPADPGRPVRIHRLLPLPLDRSRLEPRELPQVLQARHRARLDPRRLLDDLATASTP